MLYHSSCSSWLWASTRQSARPFLRQEPKKYKDQFSSFQPCVYEYTTSKLVYLTRRGWDSLSGDGLSEPVILLYTSCLILPPFLRLSCSCHTTHRFIWCASGGALNFPNIHHPNPSRNNVSSLSRMVYAMDVLLSWNRGPCNQQKSAISLDGIFGKGSSSFSLLCPVRLFSLVSLSIPERYVSKYNYPCELASRTEWDSATA